MTALDEKLIDAARDGDAGAVEALLLAGGADVSAYNEALRYAAARGHKEVVDLLVAAGADVQIAILGVLGLLR